MRKKEVTLADIARSLGVSVNAVSLALRGKGGVGSDLRQRIIKTADDMGYAPRSPQKGSILALIPQRNSVYSRGFFFHVCFYVEQYAASLGYQLVISNVSPADENALRIPSHLDMTNLAGIITLGNLTRAYCKMIRGLGKPFVMADQYYDDIDVSSVTTANTAGTYLLTEHLIENGYTAIQFFGKIGTTASLEDRWIGYCRAMARHGLTPLDNEYMHSGISGEPDGVLIERALDGIGKDVNAFVCGHDVTASIIIDALGRRGLRCPEDYAIVGFDDIQDPVIQTLRLTTYKTPQKAIAETAIDLVLSPGAAPRRIHLYGEVIFRDSVKPIQAP